jgi:hypothetical protein
MMEWFTTGPSPFLVVWHLFLLFVAVVVAVHIVCFMVSLGLKLYIAYLTKHKSESGTAK